MPMVVNVPIVSFDVLSVPYAIPFNSAIRINPTACRMGIILTLPHWLEASDYNLSLCLRVLARFEGVTQSTSRIERVGVAANLYFIAISQPDHRTPPCLHRDAGHLADREGRVAILPGHDDALHAHGQHFCQVWIVVQQGFGKVGHPLYDLASGHDILYQVRNGYLGLTHPVAPVSVSSVTRANRLFLLESVE